MKKYMQKLLEEARGLAEKAEAEKRSLNPEELARIGEIRSQIEALKGLPEIPEDVGPEGRSMPTPGQKEFRAAITTTGSGILDGDKIGEMWKIVSALNPIRSNGAQVQSFQGKSIKIPVPGKITFKTGNLQDGGMSYGNKSLDPKTYGAYVPVSNDALEDMAWDLEGDLVSRFGFCWGQQETLEMIQGAGGGSDIAGIVGQLAAGKLIAKATPTVADIDALIALLATAFQTRAIVLVNPVYFAKIMVGRSADKQILWDGTSYRVGANRVYPVDGMTAHALALDPTQYSVLQRKTMEVVTLKEIKRLDRQTLFLGELRIDAQPMDDGAFAAIVPA